MFPLGGAVDQSCSGSDGSRGRDPDALTWFESGCIVSDASLAHFWQHVRTTVARDSMEAPGVKQLSEDVTRLLKVHSHPHTYLEVWNRPDRHLSNQWMVENPNVRIDGALSGRGPVAVARLSASSGISLALLYVFMLARRSTSILVRQRLI